MHAKKTVGFALFLGVAASACGAGQSWSWRPHSHVNKAGDPIAISAIDVLEGDVQYIADARLVGTLVVSEKTSRAEAMCEAAHHGGTHVMHKNHLSKVTGSRTTSVGAAKSSPTLFSPDRVVWASSASTEIQTTELDVYAVVRIERDKWKDLPEVLRPAGTETWKGPLSDPWVGGDTSLGIWSCVRR